MQRDLEAEVNHRSNGFPIEACLGCGRHWPCKPALAAVIAELDEARTQLAKVREIHHEEHGSCGTCVDENDNPADWPCPTIAALGSTGYTCAGCGWSGESAFAGMIHVCPWPARPAPEEPGS